MRILVVNFQSLTIKVLKFYYFKLQNNLKIFKIVINVVVILI